ncbi:hypothetical protein HAZT_HAZT009754 [Hyalella azteca]|uniref:Major facilitator superfamily (MFS) profile domain-containing protein n=1 Tax=Hyalella azteca TaxID=294128 RepID=A0A6A0GPB0_HYAAZ|nr:hypothetical protein HAZT_HAZT009754 [Hyalella azteca]
MTGIRQMAVEEKAPASVKDLGWLRPAAWDPAAVIPNKAPIDFWVLSSCNTFCYDTPGSLQNEIKTDMNVSTLQFSTLYSLYSWPNVVLCFVGGFLIDRQEIL